jgi:polyisoprenoid-binding protein YceI
MNRLSVFLLAFGFYGAAFGQETTLEFDPSQTHIEWTLDSLLHTVHGTFALKRGAIHFDPVSGKAGGELVIDAASGESGSGARDRRMHKEILESQRYSEIVFVPDRVDGKIDLGGASHVNVHGQFTIHGASHDFVLPVDAKASHGQLTATSSFAVPYIQWGMKNPTTLFLKVGDAVQISITAAGKLSGN